MKAYKLWNFKCHAEPLYMYCLCGSNKVWGKEKRGKHYCCSCGECFTDLGSFYPNENGQMVCRTGLRGWSYGHSKLRRKWNLIRIRIVNWLISKYTHICLYFYEKI